ncbi:MAG: ATP-binding protein [Hyalangium sp.]|uniref:ATP-binding protein n=1 Tax=Hyalangium sp. TaxID=2028555 RepID=UPI00389A9E42
MADIPIPRATPLSGALRVGGAVFPTGLLALVFSDIQGSPQLWEQDPSGMRAALALHDAVLRDRLEANGGYEVKGQGGAFVVAFASGTDAVRWCLETQQALLHVDWPEGLLSNPHAAWEEGPEGTLHRGLRVRMGVHVGEPLCRVDPKTGRADYVGRMVDVAARVAEAGHGGQVLLSGVAWTQVAASWEVLGRPGVRPLGEFRLESLEEPIALVELLPPALAGRRFGGPRVPQELRGNVPGAVGELIGRTDELAALRRHFEAGARLVTVLGPGGMGKTRLVTHFGWRQLQAGSWEGGVWLCSLTEASSVEDICHALGEALGISLSRSGPEQEPAEQLGYALAGHGAVLVILDNMEHILPHLPATLGRWRELAPEARFLATSREALGFEGECTLDLAPLGLPAEGETRLEAISRSEAVGLFVQRSQAARGGYALTAEEAPHVAEIVRRLDGIALAIELAAARMRLLSVEQLRERLAHRFELLRGGLRAASARQDTLLGAIDWSWRLLDATERAALAQCSVFRGGFTLEAAQAVIALPVGSPEVREVIESLRSKSLLRRYVPDGLEESEARLGMYESIREYALARCAERGEGASLAERHADFHLALARQLRERVRGPGGREALRRLALERENLLAACDSALASEPAPRSVERALRGLVALEPDVAARGPVGITLPRMERALEVAAKLSVAPLLRAELLAARGRMYGASGHVAAAQRDLEAAREAFHALGEQAQQKHVLVDLSILARHAGNMDSAWSCIQQALALPSEGSAWLEAYAVGNLGLVEQLRGGAKAAIPHLRTAQKLFQAVGDEMFESGFLNNAAYALAEAGETREAMVLLREAMVKAASAGDGVGYAIARLNLGCSLLEEDRAQEASGHLEATVRLGQKLGMRILEGCARGELGRAYLALGAVEVARGFLSEAVSMLGQPARWHALRFSAHLAAVQAYAGQIAEAEAGFAKLAVAPELQQDAVLFELTSLLQVSVDLAQARAAPAGCSEAKQALERARQRVERAWKVPTEAMSSDLRGAFRFFERSLRQF